MLDKVKNLLDHCSQSLDKKSHQLYLLTRLIQCVAIEQTDKIKHLEELKLNS